MADDRFESLARELAERDRDLPAQLARAREQAETLRARAEQSLERFRSAASERGATHLLDVRVGPVEPDAKHVDCLQVRIERGRWLAVCVAKAVGSFTFVGPFKAGGSEKPCLDCAFDSPDAGAALEDLLLALLRSASER